jgi:hypothetical protein
LLTSSSGCHAFITQFSLSFTCQKLPLRNATHEQITHIIASRRYRAIKKRHT